VQEGSYFLLQGKLNEAEFSFERALALSSDPNMKAASLVALGTLHFLRGELGAAQTKFEEAEGLATIPEVRTALSFWFGLISFAQGNLSTAEEKFKQASLAPIPNVRAGALLYLATIRFNRLTQERSKSLVIPPVTSPTRITGPWFREFMQELMISLRFSSEKEWTELKFMIQEAGTLTKDQDVRAGAAVMASWMLVLEGKFAEARRQLETVVVDRLIFLSQADVHAGLSRIALMEGNWPVAVTEADRTIALLVNPARESRGPPSLPI
jgi:tetratricopeptide (TPR) repeat protein